MKKKVTVKEMSDSNKAPVDLFIKVIIICLIIKNK